MTVVNVEIGNCRLCTKAKDQEIFIVKSPGFSGHVCAKHLFILCEQVKQPQEQES